MINLATRQRVHAFDHDRSRTRNHWSSLKHAFFLCSNVLSKMCNYMRAMLSLYSRYLIRHKLKRFTIKIYICLYDQITHRFNLFISKFQNIWSTLVFDYLLVCTNLRYVILEDCESQSWKYCTSRSLLSILITMNISRTI